MEPLVTKRQLVVVLGTGRCGTTTLSVLLDAQPDSQFIHEGAIDNERNLVPWGSEAEAVAWLRDLEARTAPARWFGDADVDLLPSVRAILREWPSARFVVLIRDREETVKSFLKKTMGATTGWTTMAPSGRSTSSGIRAFRRILPSQRKTHSGPIGTITIRKINVLAREYPSSIRTWPMDALNQTEGRVRSYVLWATTRIRCRRRSHSMLIRRATRTVAIATKGQTLRSQCRGIPSRGSLQLLQGVY